ncbi:hypothetical protein LSTR_LSTR015821 [Laodelphax striatellus]|uniref:Uncharacterized protein n=1 Tax=Laodelphax striatellus TaxID=195883 RepID=A0A482WYL3_LAOST|nr:hypothetical protein LSTR_LSTR015821 [Laodelphax striatellus]
MLTGEDLHLTGDWLLDVPRRETQASVNLTAVNSAAAEHRLRLIGWYRDKRHAHARIWRESGAAVTSSSADWPAAGKAGVTSSSADWPAAGKAGVTSASGGGEQDDVVLDARLNHSRMLTASARWRTDIRSDVAASVQVGNCY